MSNPISTSMVLNRCEDAHPFSEPLRTDLFMAQFAYHRADYGRACRGDLICSDRWD